MKYNISILREAADGYTSAKEVFKSHIRNKAKKIADPKICGGKSGWELWYMVYERELSDKYAALHDMCRLIYADPNAVIAIEKSIRRNTQYQRNFQSEARLNSYLDAGSEDSYRRAVAAHEHWERHYESTGRRWNF